MIVRNSNEVVVFDTPTNNKSAEELINFIMKKLHCKINAIVRSY
jgi:metallo-beta-lactamase class B